MDFMIDLETLDTTSSAIVLSIGVVAFNRRNPLTPFDTFYAGFGVRECRDDQKAKGRTMNKDTIAWWNKQPPDAQRVLRERTVESVKDALDQFVAFINKSGIEPVVWGNGAGFDLVIMTSILKDYGLPVPWKFWNERCFRTMKAEHGHLVGPIKRLGQHHNALDDAIFQAAWLQAIYAELQKRKTV